MAALPPLLVAQQEREAPQTLVEALSHLPLQDHLASLAPAVTRLARAAAALAEPAAAEFRPGVVAQQALAPEGLAIRLAQLAVMADRG